MVFKTEEFEKKRFFQTPNKEIFVLWTKLLQYRKIVNI